MSRTANRDGEQKVPAKVARALDAWLAGYGLGRGVLAKHMQAPPRQVGRMFAGSAYISATQRQAIEVFTGGEITVAMLEGKTPPPSKAKPRKRTGVERAAEKLAAKILAEVLPTFIDLLREEVRREGADQAGDGGAR